MNGGFNQYFWNSSAAYAEDTPAALAAIGTPVGAELMQKAIAIAIAENPHMAKYRRENTAEAFSESYKHTELNELDGPFCKDAARFPALRVSYVRLHPKAFVVTQ